MEVGFVAIRLCGWGARLQNFVVFGVKGLFGMWSDNRQWGKSFRLMFRA